MRQACDFMLVARLDRSARAPWPGCFCLDRCSDGRFAHRRGCPGVHRGSAIFRHARASDELVAVRAIAVVDAAAQQPVMTAKFARPDCPSAHASLTGSLVIIGGL